VLQDVRPLVRQPCPSLVLRDISRAVQVAVDENSLNSSQISIYHHWHPETDINPQKPEMYPNIKIFSSIFTESTRSPPQRPVSRSVLLWTRTAVYCENNTEWNWILYCASGGRRSVFLSMADMGQLYQQSHTEKTGWMQLSPSSATFPHFMQHEDL
jgi:hypothetical protein